MTCDWEALLKKEKNSKHLLTGLAIHTLTGKREVVQMLNKLNSCRSYTEIGPQNKSWACIVVSSKRMGNHMRKGLPVQATIDNNDGVQRMTRK